ncbi:MAG TPA: hypothetical protein VF221_05680, partial [Chloroflexota bacterium]
SVESALHLLRENGASAVDSIVFLRDAFDISLTEAERKVQGSAAWRGAHVTTAGTRTSNDQTELGALTVHAENMRITQTTVNEVKQRLDAGATTEELLRFLRDNGANPIDSIIVLRAFLKISLKEARQLLHASETWSQFRYTG